MPRWHHFKAIRGQRRLRGADNGVIPATPSGRMAPFFVWALPLPAAVAGRGSRPRRPLSHGECDEPFVLAGRTPPDADRGLPLLRPELHGLVPARPDAG